MTGTSVRRRPRAKGPGVPLRAGGQVADGCVQPASHFVAGQAEVCGVGVDTWSLCWYAKPGSRLHSALRSLATMQAERALLVPEKVANHRIGWFPDHGLVFAEGHLEGSGLCAAADIPSRALGLIKELKNVGIPVKGISSALVRRLDVAVDLRIASSAEGLALLECVGSISPLDKKVVTYRAGSVIESVLLKSRAARTQARIYDKGGEQGGFERGRWIRFEAQWRFARAQRLAPGDLTGDLLRERFLQRFKVLHGAAGGFEVGGANAVAGRIAEHVAAGRLVPSRARSIAGYLLLSAAGVSQGARRTEYELERECRRLGLSMSLTDSTTGLYVDVADVLDKCMSRDIW
jgi:hypothetical protein